MPFEIALTCLSLLGLIACWWAIVPARRIAVGTTLTAPWAWLIGGLGMWSAAWAASIAFHASQGLVDRLGYLSAVSLLAPPIAVLGARRPGGAVWGWFVVLPMLCVLGLPAVSGAWWGGEMAGRLRLDAPPLIGFALVLVMGVGNYVGTRFTPAALVYGLALLLQVAPASAFGVNVRPGPLMFRAGATLCLGLAAWLAVRAGRRVPRRQEPLDALWIEFRDLFGVVWAKRSLERVNHSARAQQWPVRLHLDGFAPLEGPADSRLDRETAKKIEDLLRWLLKRFVDEEWIDRRLARAARE
ncbi:MAG: hypothetical protein WED34_13275 [Planctomycetales bacterium]